MLIYVAHIDLLTLTAMELPLTDLDEDYTTMEQ